VTLVDVVLIETGFRPRTVIPMGLVNIAFFSSNHEGRGFVVREIKRGNGNLPCFVMPSVDEFERFLLRGKTSRPVKQQGVTKHTWG
jgi:hypothetical protein